LLGIDRSAGPAVAHGFLNAVRCALPHECRVACPPTVVEPVWDVGIYLPDIEYLVLHCATVGNRDLLVVPQSVLPEVVDLYLDPGLGITAVAAISIHLEYITDRSGPWQNECRQGFGGGEVSDVGNGRPGGDDDGA